MAPIWRVSIGYVAYFSAVGAAWPYLPIYYRELGLSRAAIGSLDPTLDRKPALLEQRGGAFYSEAAAELMASLHAGTGAVHVVDVRNVGALPDLPPAAVVEIPARVDRDGAHPLPLAALAPEIRGLVQRAKAYEVLAVRAATTGDRRVALLALLANPLVPDHRAAEGLLEAILAANARFPTRFAA